MVLLHRIAQSRMVTGLRGERGDVPGWAAI